MARKKISIIGSGNVGSTCAHWLAQKELADIVLLDILDGLAAGKALDLYEASPIGHFDVNFIGTGDYQHTVGSDLVIITSGLPRKPGMSRDDLLKKNTEIVVDVTRKLCRLSPDALLIVVCNPLDVMTFVVAEVSGFPQKRVMGMAGILDTARYRSFIAEALGVSVNDVAAMLLGGHGDDMVPLPRYTTVAGIPLAELMDQRKIEAIVERTRQGGGEIVNLMKTASAYYAPAAAAAEMAEAIIKDKKRVLPCCAWCDQEYGVGGAYVGVPIVLGAAGVEKIIELQLTPQEKHLFENSVSHVKQLVNQVKTFISS